VREYVHKKRGIFALTIVLLIILTFEFYYMNCYTIYVPFFCELTFIYVLLAIIVANVWYYFSGDHGGKTVSKEATKKEAAKGKSG
jgi:hypothetical protein